MMLPRKASKHVLIPTEGIVLDLYNRGGVIDEANCARRDLNIKGLGALDLRARKANGSMWDFWRWSWLISPGQMLSLAHLLGLPFRPVALWLLGILSPNSFSSALCSFSSSALDVL